MPPAPPLTPTPGAGAGPARPAGLAAMSVDDVAVWLQRAGFGALEGAFRANFVSGRALLRLEEADLEQLGLAAPLARKNFRLEARPLGLRPRRPSRPTLGLLCPPAQLDALKAQAEEAEAAPRPGHAHAPPGLGLAGAPAGPGALRYDAFISYAHADAPTVRRYVERLEAAGFSLWVDRELKAGQQWLEVIAEAMVCCRTYVCFLSTHYFASKNCDDEMQYAHHKLRIPKIPVWLCDPATPGLKMRRDYEVMLAGLTHTAQLGPEAPHVDAACRALAEGLRSFGLPGPRAAPHGGPHHGPAATP
eukprot:tig00000293_g23880.t1